MTTPSLRPTPRRLLLGAALAAYLYSLLAATAWGFYELYHLTGIDFIYHFYSVFKAAAYYFGSWDYQWLACLALGMLAALPWWEFLKTSLRRRA
ncbi:hypothetical protein [Spongiibacter sp.]|uniref:hypothetical protein n=1 Tax=Spongiibacter sp. TaxID=2024860 RepID=UPI0035617BF6